MKGDASATKDASPTPTNMRQTSRLQNPAFKRAHSGTLQR